MSSRFQRITPFRGFDHQAEEAAAFYVSIFEHARILTTTRYTRERAQASGCREGTVMTVDFAPDGQSVAAFNGGPLFRFNAAVSRVVHCRSRDEVDHYRDRLLEGAPGKTGQCGWLKDRYGLSWQVVPDEMIRTRSRA